MVKSATELTRDEIEEFEDSKIWLCLRAELYEWLDQIRDVLELETDLQRIYNLQGSAEAVRKVLNITSFLTEDYHGRNTRGPDASGRN